jgi:hypothetical protein
VDIPNFEGRGGGGGNQQRHLSQRGRAGETGRNWPSLLGTKYRQEDKRMPHSNGLIYCHHGSPSEQRAARFTEAPGVRAGVERGRVGWPLSGPSALLPGPAIGGAQGRAPLVDSPVPPWWTRQHGNTAACRRTSAKSRPRERRPRAPRLATWCVAVGRVMCQATRKYAGAPLVDSPTRQHGSVCKRIICTSCGKKQAASKWVVVVV